MRFLYDFNAFSMQFQCDFNAISMISMRFQCTLPFNAIQCSSIAFLCDLFFAFAFAFQTFLKCFSALGLHLALPSCFFNHVLLASLLVFSIWRRKSSLREFLRFSTIVFIRLRFSTASSVLPMDVRLACGTSYTTLCAPCFTHASCFHMSTHGDYRLHPRGIRLFALRFWFTLLRPLDTIAMKRKGVGAGGSHPNKAMIDVHLQYMDGVREGGSTLSRYSHDAG